MNGRWWPLLIVILWATIAEAATPVSTSLAPAERAALERQVCLGPADQLTAIAERQLRIVCPAHTTLAGLPALYVAECARPARQWHCNRAALAVRAPVGARSVLLTPHGGSFAIARDAARALIEHPRYFNGRNLAEMLQGLCIVEDLGSGAFAGARDYRVRCGNRGVIVTNACAGEACRMFPARWDDTPEGAG